jgi:SAM-dependent methyltransferase
VSREPESGLEELLAEQQRYYRARAPCYAAEALAPLGGAEASALRGELGEAFDAHLGGDVLELACGPGTWTAMLAQRARAVTALDGAPEMLEQAALSAPGANVRFEQADLWLLPLPRARGARSGLPVVVVAGAAGPAQQHRSDTGRCSVPVASRTA